MSASWSRSDSAEWSYRTISQRLIVVKGKNVNAQNMTVMDELTSLPFAIEVREKDVLESLTVDKEYLADFKVYTASNIEGVDKQFTDFFEALDIDQKIENFQEAFAVYPTKIRFELASIEEAQTV
jgi:hypothetical protein